MRPSVDVGLSHLLTVILAFFSRANLAYSDSQVVLGAVDEDVSTCSILNGLFRDQVFFPDSDGYAFRQDQYWSVQQSELQPTCRFIPSSEADLRLALILLSQRQEPIAIESGGHSFKTGASNINNGITIDLLQLSSITLTDANQTVWLGPAARWSDVYATLQPLGLTVSGGRVGTVGVGGYVLGGGFSWFANEHGWTSDSVLEFEVITPSRKLLHARADWNADLLWALRGSLGAFGIVTAIKVPTIPNRAVYGGALSFEVAETPVLFSALRDLNANAKADLKSHGYLSFAYLASKKEHVYTAYLLNTAGEDSPAFSNFTSIPHSQSTLRNTTLKVSADEIASGNPLGYCRTKFTLTSRNTLEAMEAIHTIFLDRTNPNKTTFDGASLLGINIQPLTIPHLEAGSGSIFSLNPEDGPLLLLSAELWWQNAQQDTYYEEQMRALHDAWQQELERVGDAHPWVYPNYAARWQDPFLGGSLPRETLKALRRVKEKYDPEDVWRKLVPGLWHT